MNATNLPANEPDDDDQPLKHVVENVSSRPKHLFAEAKRLDKPLPSPLYPKSLLWQAARASARDREHFVHQSVERLFATSVSAARPRLLSLRGRLDRYLEAAQERIERIRSTASKQKLHHEISGPGQPWTIFAVATAVILLGAKVALLMGALTQLGLILDTIDIFSLEEGASPTTMITFVGICAAIPAKLIPTLLQSDAARRTYALLVHAVALLLGIAWSVVFTTTWGPEFQAILDGGGGLSLDFALPDATFPPAEAAETPPPILYMCTTFLAEIALACSCWLGIDHLWNHHRSSSLSLNPVRVDLECRARREQEVLDEGLNLRDGVAEELERLRAAEDSFAAEILASANRLAADASAQALVGELVNQTVNITSPGSEAEHADQGLKAAPEPAAGNPSDDHLPGPHLRRTSTLNGRPSTPDPTPNS